MLGRLLLQQLNEIQSNHHILFRIIFSSFLNFKFSMLHLISSILFFLLFPMLATLPVSLVNPFDWFQTTFPVHDDYTVFYSHSPMNLQCLPELCHLKIWLTGTIFHLPVHSWNHSTDTAHEMPWSKEEWTMRYRNSKTEFVSKI